MKQGKKNTTVKQKNGVHTKVKKDLDKYADKILFPEKLSKANKLLKGVKLP
ncbi:MAG: hypothetical protein ACHQF0_13310 [Chitinophagales bacterium]